MLFAKFVLFVASDVSADASVVKSTARVDRYPDIAVLFAAAFVLFVTIAAF